MLMTIRSDQNLEIAMHSSSFQIQKKLRFINLKKELSVIFRNSSCLFLIAVVRI